jgi:hypothetical protein
MPRSYKEDNWGNPASSLPQAVKKKGSWKGAAIQTGFECNSFRICTVRSHYQGTAGEGTADGKGLSVCCGNLKIVEISDCAVITNNFCSRLCV